MDYNTMDYVSNGIIVSNIKQSKILNINKAGREILKINDDNKVTSLGQLITGVVEYENFKKRIIEDNEKYGKSEGVVYLNALDSTIVEISFICIAQSDNSDIVHYVFHKATEVTDEKQISFKDLADKLPSGIVVMDIENELAITYANTEHYKMIGIDVETIDPNKKYLLKDFILPEDLNWVMAEIYTDFSDNKDIDIEFRMKTECDNEKWVRLYGRTILSENGEKLFYSSLINLSKRSYIYDKLHMERVLFHKITELTEDRIFRIDLATNILSTLGNRNNSFGEIAVYENYKESLLKTNRVYVEDLNVYKEIIGCFENGIEKSFELRYLVDEDRGEFEWCKVTYTFIRNSYGKAISVVGKLTNINSQKILEEQAKTDLLTHFYNKMTTEHEVNRLIRTQGDQKHALFIVDIDNFKAINDNLGHHFGDIVLSDIANDIKSCFRTKDILGRIRGRRVDNENFETAIRKKDILGRIGGDEFIVVMRNIDDEEIVLDKAQVICSMLDKTFTNKEKNKSYYISASVGISIYPNNGTTYEELYKKSDIALYDIKNTGKNGYKVYSEELSQTNSNHSMKNSDINSYKVININTMVLSSVLNLLYETRDLDTSITAIMMYLGNVFKVDRCYIFNMGKDDNNYENRYRWVRQGIDDDLDEGIDNKNIDNILRETDENGVFYTNDIHSIEDKVVVERLEVEKVKSIFLVESLKEDKDCLILGLEDCTGKREWTENEVVTLLHIGRLIFTAVNNDSTIKRLTSKK